MKHLDKWKTRLKLRRLSVVAIAVTAFMSVSIVLLTIYGSNVGNFVVTVEEGFQEAITLSETPGFENPKVMLTAEGLKSITNYSYRYLPDNIGEKDGSDNGNSTYVAYSFYIKNKSNHPIPYRMEITVRKVYKNVDYALWIMVIKDGVRTVYAMPKTDALGQIVLDGQGKPVPEDASGHYPNLTVPFKSSLTLVSELYHNFREGEVSRYTVVMWLEGEDPQCDDEIKGGTLQLDMQFTPAL